MKKMYFFVVFLLIGFQCHSQIINFLDVNFKAALIAPLNNSVAYDNNGDVVLIDANGNGEIEIIEAANPNINTIWISNLNLTNLSGIENFINIKRLDCSLNSLTFLNVQGMVNLVTLNCENNQLTTLLCNWLPNLDSITCEQNNLSTIDISQCTVFRYLRIYENQLVNLNLNGLAFLTGVEAQNNLLTSIEFSGTNSLLDLNVRNNFLTSLDVTSLTNLGGLDCALNQLTSLNVTGLANMSGLNCDFNLLENIDLSGLSNLSSFNCTNNNIISLDFSSCTSLFAIECQNNQLEYLNIKNGAQESNIYFSGNPTLEYICADENQLSLIENLLYMNGNTLCNFNTYCSFAPGGNYYTIQGSQKIDFEDNGCDSNDLAYPNLHFSISDGIINGDFISNSSGNYSIPLQQGTYSIIPILENPTYFNVSPSSIQLTFPETISPNNQNFCITPNGVHNDLEVVIIPLIPARPGFDATYKIIYKNKGNSTLSGSVVFNFEDDKMDILSSIPNYSFQSTNQLTYNYTNLSPFESGEILITININSPMEITAVNIDDQLNFVANIYPILGDEFLQDNNSSLKQIVVGSFDPNDKTCIEGNTVGTEMIGQYIHYIIRFENTGTFPAENIVVKDIIDLTKFDLSTLIPVSSSHSFVTRIASYGSVEFVFENIQLPFDDANNDGYIVFKIKTISGLSIGDTLTNKANIYFDYNFPIETNMTSTTIQNLKKTDFNFNYFIVLYPNPTNSILNFKIKNNIDISSINIYNSLGQLVLVTTNPNESINVSTLKTGMYFVKIVSNLGESISKFLKK